MEQFDDWPLSDQTTDKSLKNDSNELQKTISELEAAITEHTVATLKLRVHHIINENADRIENMVIRACEKSAEEYLRKFIINNELFRQDIDNILIDHYALVQESFRNVITKKYTQMHLDPKKSRLSNVSTEMINTLIKEKVQPIFDEIVKPDFIREIVKRESYNKTKYLLKQKIDSIYTYTSLICLIIAGLLIILVVINR